MKKNNARAPVILNGAKRKDAIGVMKIREKYNSVNELFKIRTRTNFKIWYNFIDRKTEAQTVTAFKSL